MLTAPVWREPNFLNAFGGFSRQANVADVFAKSTGGRHDSFLRQNTVERVIAEIGTELHTQYLLSFTPRPADPERFHTIRVAIAGRPDLTVRTRAGYWPVAD